MIKNKTSLQNSPMTTVNVPQTCMVKTIQKLDTPNSSTRFYSSPFRKFPKHCVILDCVNSIMKPLMRVMIWIMWNFQFISNFKYEVPWKLCSPQTGLNSFFWVPAFTTLLRTAFHALFVKHLTLRQSVPPFRRPHLPPPHLHDPIKVSSGL